MAIEGTDNKYSQKYLNDINAVLTNRMDGNTDGKKDGKVTIQEAYKYLNIGHLLSGLQKDSNEYNKLKALTDKVPQVLQKYAGQDGLFKAEEWANFLNGNEWNEVIDTYHSSSNFAKIEMKWVDDSKGMIHDGKTTKGEVKIGLLNNLYKSNLVKVGEKKAIANRLEALVDKYAGEDGTFTVEEYTAMKNDTEYKQITNDLHLVPFRLNEREANYSDAVFARNLPQNPNATETTLQVGQGAKKIKGYSAQNPETGEMVYADETGRSFTRQAFKHWEQFAKNVHN